MANSNSPFGFVPVRTMGGEGSPAQNEYAIESGYGTQISLGDLVGFAGDSSAFGVPLISIAGTTTVMVGVFNGCEYINSSGEPIFSNNWPASTAPLTGTRIKAFVYDDPRTIFKARVSDGLATTDMPNNAQLTAGSPTNGVSGAGVDSTTFATTSTHGLRVLRLHPAPDNELGQYGIVELQINRSAFANQLATGT